LNVARIIAGFGKATSAEFKKCYALLHAFKRRQWW
jgi:hypothetical protein